MPDGVHEVHSNVGTSWKSHREDSAVDVFHLRDRPEKFKLKSIADTLFFVIPTGIGIAKRRSRIGESLFYLGIWGAWGARFCLYPSNSICLEKGNKQERKQAEI